MPNQFWYWENRVPPDLIPAVKHVRHSFEDARWKTDTITHNCCYACLHPHPAPSLEIKEFASQLLLLKGYVGPSGAALFNDLIKNETPSSILSAFFHIYKWVMARELNTAFRELLEIGLANALHLETTPIEWANWQAKSVINNASYHVGFWLKCCCDGLKLDANFDPNASEEEERVWTDWQAPRFARMQPSLGMPYDASRANEREDVETSRGVVEAFKKHFVIHLEAKLKECVGIAHLEYAKRPKTTISTDTGRSPESPVITETAPSGKESLTKQQIGDVAGAHTWKQLGDKFLSIEANAPGQRFSATFIPTGADSSAVSRKWILGGKPNSRTEFGDLASIAARKLGYSQREGATDYWLDRVREWVQENGLDKDGNVAWRANIRTGQALDIQKIAALSGRVCRNLMTRGMPESAVSQSSKCELIHSNGYQTIEYKGQTYQLTKLSAEIVQMLHEDYSNGGSGLTFISIKKKVKCGKVWDAFRSRDGRRFRNDLIEKRGNDALRLRL